MNLMSLMKIKKSLILSILFSLLFFSLSNGTRANDTSSKCEVKKGSSLLKFAKGYLDNGKAEKHLRKDIRLEAKDGKFELDFYQEGDEYSQVLDIFKKEGFKIENIENCEWANKKISWKDDNFKGKSSFYQKLSQTSKRNINKVTK